MGEDGEPRLGADWLAAFLASWVLEPRTTGLVGLVDRCQGLVPRSDRVG